MEDKKVYNNKEQHEKVMVECLQLSKECIKNKTAAWELLAKKYGYKNWKSLRDTFYRWNKRKSNKESLSELEKSFRSIKVPDIKNEIKKDFEKGISIKDAENKYRINMEAIENLIDVFRKTGLNVQITDNIIHVSKHIIYQDNVTINNWNNEKIIRFGVITDTHIGSKYQQLTLMEKTYDIFASEGIDNVYHAGDISEGIKMRPGHEQECFLHGADDVEDYIIEKFPRRDNIKTHFITGNHDHSFIKQSGHDIGKRIADERKDMIYLGMSNAKVFLTPNCTMELNHPLDGAAYALSYSIQKLADSLSGGEKPNILINGHHHKAMYLFYRNIHMLEAGCFEAQTPWMKGKRLAAHVGGYIVTVHVNEKGEITRFMPEFIPFYEMIKNDWK